MKKQRLHFRFHNPNPDAETADYILRVFVEANQKKVEAALKAATDQSPDTQEKLSG